MRRTAPVGIVALLVVCFAGVASGQDTGNPGGSLPPATGGENPPPTGEVTTPPASETPPPAADAPPPSDSKVPEGVTTLGQNKKLPKNFKGIIGRVTDAKTGEGLIEATIKVVAGGKKSALTDIEGYYRLRLPPGTYDLRVFYELYEGRRISNVEITETNSVVKLDVALQSDSRSVQEVVVEAKADKRNESALLQERRKAAVASDSIAAQEIARTPDANAGEAVKRVVSATVVDGRYVFLRGLGGRYALTLLNGSLLPSPEPDEPSVPLDLFPSALVSDLNVLKTYSPDLPATFGGGTLVVGTNTFPTRLDVKVRVTASGDTQTTFQSRLADPTSSIGENFGFQNPRRALPRGFPQDYPVFLKEGSPITPADRIAAGKLLNNTWTPVQGPNAVPNTSVAAQVGNTFKLGKESRFGFIVAAQWSRKELTRRIFTENPQVVGSEIASVDSFQNVTGSLSGTSSVLVNLGLQVNRDNEITVLGLWLNNFDAQALSLDGTNDVMTRQISSRLNPVQRTLLYSQVRGFHRIGALNEAEIEWQGNYAQANREENDIRDFSQEDSGGGLIWSTQPGSGDRFFVSLLERSGGGTLNYTQPLIPSLKLKVGGLFQYSERVFSGRRFRYRNLGGLPLEVLAGRAEGIFDGANLDSGIIRFDENTRAPDGYDAQQYVYGGYGLLEWRPVDWFRTQAGVRYEGTRLLLSAASKFSIEPPDANPDPVNRTYDDVVPSVNLQFSPLGTINIRSAYAYTLARPTFRELGPFLFYDYIRRRDVTGNPELVQTRIHHADLRFEWFPGDTEVFAITGFYKRFVNPIERLATGGGAGGGGQFIFKNTDGADLLGGEFEFRVGLGRLTKVLSDFRVGANLALVWSQITIAAIPGVNVTNSQRPLQGQSPWVVNAYIQWNHEASGTELGVFYNVYGPRISEIGTENVPDYYEQPFHGLDFVATQRLPAGFSIKLSVANMLDYTRFITSGPVTAWSYKPGVQFQLALGWSLPQ